MAYTLPSAHENSIFRVDPRHNISSGQTVTSSGCYNLARLEGYNPSEAFAQSAYIINGTSPYIRETGGEYYWTIGGNAYFQLIKLSGVGINPGQTFSYAFCIEPSVELSNQSTAYLVDFYNIGNFRVGWDGPGKGISIQRYLDGDTDTVAYPFKYLCSKKYLIVVTVSSDSVEVFINGISQGKTDVSGELVNPTGNFVIKSNNSEVTFKLYGFEMFNKELSLEEILDIAVNIYGLDIEINPYVENTDASLTVADSVIRDGSNNCLFGSNWNLLTGNFKDGSDTIWNNETIENKFSLACSRSGINTFRFPGGHDVSYIWWDLHEEITAGRKNKAYLQTLMTNTRVNIPAISSWMPAEMPYTPTIQEYLAFLKRNDFKTTLQVNLHNYWDSDNDVFVLIKADPYIDGNRQWGTGEVNWTQVDATCNSLKTLAQYIVDNDFTNNVLWFEINNEDYGKDSLECESKYTGEEYGEICCRVIDSITEILPNAKFIITGYVHNDRFNNPNASELYQNTELAQFVDSMLKYQGLIDRKNYIHAIAHHQYNTSDDADGTDGDYELSTYMNRQWGVGGDIITTFKTYLDSLNWNDLKVFVNETNNSSFASPQNHSWMSSIRLFQNFIGCLNSPEIGHVDYHTITHATYSKGILWGYGLLHYAKDGSDIMMQHNECYVHQLMNNMANNNILMTTSDNPEVLICCGKLHDRLNIYILSLKDVHNITLDLSDFSVSRIHAKSIYFYNAFTLIDHNSNYNNSSKNLSMLQKNKLGVVNSDNIITFSMKKNEIALLRVYIGE